MNARIASVVSWIATCPALAHAQHCAPILESYLSQITIKSDVTPIDAAPESAIELVLEYAKTGGQPKRAYQVYLVAYREGDESKVPAPAPAEFLDKKLVRVLHTQVAPRNELGRYAIKVRFGKEDLANKLLEVDRGNANDAGADENQGFSGNVRLAVFIPFLEDRTYAALDGLPVDRHECNYRQDRALLFQPLPWTLKVWTTEGGRRVIVSQSK